MTVGQLAPEARLLADPGIPYVDQQVAEAVSVEPIIHAARREAPSNWQRALLAAGMVAALAVTAACRGDSYTSGDPVEIPKGTDVYTFANDNNSTAPVKCGDARDTTSNVPRRTYTDKAGSWYGWSAPQFSIDGDCPSLGYVWTKKK